MAADYTRSDSQVTMTYFNSSIPYIDLQRSGGGGGGVFGVESTVPPIVPGDFAGGTKRYKAFLLKAEKQLQLKFVRTKWLIN